MKQLLKKSNSDGILALLLFAVFAVCILSVLLTGADSFKSLSARDQASFDRRTAAQYIATRVRQSDKLDGLTLEDFEGVTALVSREEYGGEPYLTRVYFHDGYICELFSSADAALLPEDGERIMPAGALTFREEDGLVTAVVSDRDGTSAVISIAHRSGEEVAP